MIFRFFPPLILPGDLTAAKINCEQQKIARRNNQEETNREIATRAIHLKSN